MDMLTELRYYHFIAGVLANQQHDRFCSICKAFTNSAQQIREDVKIFMMTHSAELTGLPEQNAVMLAEMKTKLSDLHPVTDSVGQKKAGNCLLLQGVCFVKNSKGLIDSIRG